MKEDVYISLEEAENTGYVIINRIIFQEDIEEIYNSHVSFVKESSNNNQVETLEGFKLTYLFVEVNYDEKKRKIYINDIIETLSQKGLIIWVSEGGIYGDYYKQTEKLKSIMNEQYNRRKKLAGVV